MALRSSFLYGVTKMRLAGLRHLATLANSSVPAAEVMPARIRGRVPEAIWRRTSARLHKKPLHPLCTLRTEIASYFENRHPGVFNMHSDLSPIVTTKQCFDDLLVPVDHPSRAPTDTYYVDDDVVLRTHMTAHDVAFMQQGKTALLLCGDVYRRDTVDRTHYPVFHQVDSMRLYPPATERALIQRDLQADLTGLAYHLFGSDAKLRWVDGYFPFTSPSFELEVFWEGEWLELLGCGLLHREVLFKANVASDVNGWAFGLGLERLAMVLFQIPDIRLFWSEDERFASQFSSGTLSDRFKPFSSFPSVEKDISFWVNGNFHENDLCEIARSLGGDLVENVSLLDRFQRDGNISLCYRMVFRSMERSLTHDEINNIYYDIRESVATSLPVTLR